MSHIAATLHKGNKEKQNGNCGDKGYYASYSGAYPFNYQAVKCRVDSHGKEPVAQLIHSKVYQR